MTPFALHDVPRPLLRRVRLIGTPKRRTGPQQGHLLVSILAASMLLRKLRRLHAIHEQRAPHHRRTPLRHRLRQALLVLLLGPSQLSLRPPQRTQTIARDDGRRVGVRGNVDGTANRCAPRALGGTPVVCPGGARDPADDARAATHAPDGDARLLGRPKELRLMPWRGNTLHLWLRILR